MGRRLLARVLDGLIICLPLYLINGLLIGGAAVDAQATNDPDVVGGLLAAISGVMLLTVLVIGLYEIIMIAVIGATLGKLIVGVKVVGEATGRPPGFGSSLLRWLIPTAGGLLCGIGALVVYLSPLFDKSGRSQGWHDRVAKTLAISTK
jgi:uncharacterized RDD family membrane protein YckC